MPPDGAAAGWMLQAGTSTERPLAVLSGNDIEHALLGIGAMYAGVPYAPVSPSSSLVSSDLGRLGRILELLTPGVVFASDGVEFGRALDAAAGFRYYEIDAQGQRQRRAAIVCTKEEYPTESAARKCPAVQAILLRLNADSRRLHRAPQSLEP